jgi:preprotein translocase subunit Sss1
VPCLERKEMIDPLTALAGIQAAVALIKKVSKTVDDVSSLGPVLGKYFDAKSTATKAVVQAKKSKSSMGTAIQIEMALDQAKRFEDELQLLFMQSGKVDVWNKIKSRAAAMDVESAHDARREREAAAKRKKEMDELIEIVLIALVFFIMIGAIGYFSIEILTQCAGNCSFQK